MNAPRQDELQQGLRDAIRARDAVATRALRSALAAIANAEAVAPSPSAPSWPGVTLFVPAGQVPDWRTRDGLW